MYSRRVVRRIKTLCSSLFPWLVSPLSDRHISNAVTAAGACDGSACFLVRLLSFAILHSGVEKTHFPFFLWQFLADLLYSYMTQIDFVRPSIMYEYSYRIFFLSCKPSKAHHGHVPFVWGNQSIDDLMTSLMGDERLWLSGSDEEVGSLTVCHRAQQPHRHGSLGKRQQGNHTSHRLG